MNNFVDLKWNKLLRRARLFNFIPFIEIIFVAGSMAMGSASEDSDFDFIIGVKTGRIFTARFFCFFFFGILGWRRKRGAEGKDVKDKFCFNHFVASEKYTLSAPYDRYCQKLFASLVPIYGDEEKIQKFYDANESWTGPVRNSLPKRSFEPRLRAGVVSNGMEWLLSGKLGNFLEKWLKKIQIKKIEKSLKTENLHKPRIIFNDSELEFHSRPKRKEEYTNKLEVK